MILNTRLFASKIDKLSAIVLWNINDDDDINTNDSISPKSLDLKKRKQHKSHPIKYVYIIHIDGFIWYIPSKYGTITTERYIFGMVHKNVTRAKPNFKSNSM